MFCPLGHSRVVHSLPLVLTESRSAEMMTIIAQINDEQQRADEH